MDKKLLNKINKAKVFFEDGFTQKEIAEKMGVSEAAVSSWKNKGEELGQVWAVKKGAGKRIAVDAWIEERLQKVLSQITDHSVGTAPDELYKEFDRLLDGRKKYEVGTDVYGETIRVMSKFNAYVRDNHPDTVHLLKDVVSSYTRSVAR